MNTRFVLLCIIFFLFVKLEVLAQEKQVELCVGHYQTEEEAVRQLKRFASTYGNKGEWERRAAGIRQGIVTGAELDLIPDKYRSSNFNPIMHSKKVFSDIS